MYTIGTCQLCDSGYHDFRNSGLDPGQSLRDWFQLCMCCGVKDRSHFSSIPMSLGMHTPAVKIVGDMGR